MSKYFTKSQLKNVKLFFYFLLLIFFPVLNSCDENETELPIDIQDIATDDSAIGYIRELGFRDSDIQDFGAYYLVEGDILFSKTSSAKLSGVKEAKVSQNGHGAYVGSSIPIVKVYIDFSVTPGTISLSNFVAEVESAMAMWNSIPGTRLKFERTTNTAAAHITIKSSASQLGCGSGSFPAGGAPGNEIFIHTNKISGRTSQSIAVGIAHELGHTVGLRHTNMSEGVHIPGTPTSDAVSLMNAAICESTTPPTALSPADKQAFQYLYTAPTPPIVIFGQKFICTSNVYTISGLPSGATVTWSIPTSAGPVLLLSPNQPSMNSLTITNQNWYQISTTLTATITYGSNTPTTCTLPIANDAPIFNKPYTQSACTAYYNNGVSATHPAQSGSVSNNTTTFVHAGCAIQVYLQLPSTKQIVLGAGSGIPINWSHSGPYLFFTLPANSVGIPFIFKVVSSVNDGSCPSTITFKTLANY